jgi:hypothetical protein
MTKVFGWWSPAEALLHPDVLAAYAPWLSAIANSFQAGFWEEALFRAVPLAGAALIGERVGQRKLFLVLGFIVQAAIFGAGHAPYPNQPAYARPVELIIPSIGFGLLYIYFGLLPGIILHFAFDVVWFSLPIFLADAPGIWFQQLMVVVMTFVPLWIVLWRRAQAGRWTELLPEDRNAAWAPAPASEPAPVRVIAPHPALSPRTRAAWMILGVAGLAISALAIVRQPGSSPGLSVSRSEAAVLARQALESRAVRLTPGWRVLPRPDDGSGGAHEFVSETAGEDRRKSLVGLYLPGPRWYVRAATFEGDIEARAEEWNLYVSPTREVRGVQHTLPEARPGAALDETAARQLALAAVAERFKIDPARGQVREVSARPEKLKARTDWTFILADTTVPPLPEGEPRMLVRVAGDEVAGVSRFVFVPEEWERRYRAAQTRNLIITVANRFVFGGLLVAAAALAVLMWSRKRYTPRLFVAVALLVFAVSLARSANSWPTTEAQLLTALPLALQVTGAIGIGLVALAVTSTLVGLAFGAFPQRLASSARLPAADASRLGVAVGLVGTALAAIASRLSTPAWARVPDLDALGTFFPLGQVAIDPISGLLLRIAVLLSALALIEDATAGWTRRRASAVALLAVIGFLGAGTPVGQHLGGWLLAGLVLAIALPIVSLCVLRFDLTMVPIALGTMMVVAALKAGVEREFPGALPGSLIAAALIVLTTWWVFQSLRRWRDAVEAAAVG